MIFFFEKEEPIMKKLFIVYFLFLNHCLFIQKGVEQLNTLIFVIIGIFFLYIGIQFLMWHLGREKKKPLVRFFIGLLAGILIFIA